MGLKLLHILKSPISINSPFKATSTTISSYLITWLIRNSHCCYSQFRNWAKRSSDLRSCLVINLDISILIARYDFPLVWVELHAIYWVFAFKDSLGVCLSKIVDFDTAVFITRVDPFTISLEPYCCNIARS